MVLTTRSFRSRRHGKQKPCSQNQTQSSYIRNIRWGTKLVGRVWRMSAIGCGRSLINSSPAAVFEANLLDDVHRLFSCNVPVELLRTPYCIFSKSLTQMIVPQHQQYFLGELFTVSLLVEKAGFPLHDRIAQPLHIA